jgi:hypothetical protein
LYQFSLYQKESYMAELSLLRSELKQIQDQKSALLEQIASNLATTQATSNNTLNGLHVFYFFFGVVFVCVSAYVMYSFFSPSNSSPPSPPSNPVEVFEPSKKTLDALLEGDTVLADSLMRIDNHLLQINNLTLTHLSEQITVVERKIDELSAQIGILGTPLSPVGFDAGTLMEVLRDTPEVFFSLL